MFIIVLLLACSEDVYEGADLAKVGTNYTLSTNSTATTTMYRVAGGGEAVEASSLIEVAADCPTASAVLTSYTQIAQEETLQLMQVVAHTKLNHPLIPDAEDVFSEREAMVLQERVRTGATLYVEETLYDATNFATYNTNTYTAEAQTTDSSYFGVTADEYVVRFELGNLWSDFEELTALDVSLWTKNEPVVGDVWVSENGNTLYIYAGKDVINLGPLPQEVHKVEMYEVAAIQADGSQVYDDCLNFGANQIQTSDPNQSQQDLEEVFLDAGCADTFTHVKTGTQWWYKNMLVKEEASSMEVEILDYGFEWYEQDLNAGTCTRMTSTIYGDSLVPVEPYIEYALTTKTYITELSDWIEPQ
jgi:hypothetical protein